MKLHLRSLYRNLVAGTRLALFLPVRPYDYRASPLDFTLLVAFNFAVWIAAAAMRTGAVGDFDETAIPIYLGSIPLVLLTATLAVVRVRPEKGLVNLSTTCTAVDGRVVWEGEALVLMKEMV